MALGFTQTAHKLAVPYRKVFDAGTAGRFPCSFVNNRWSVDEVDLPLVAAALGVKMPAAAAPAAAKRARKATREPQLAA